MKSNRTPSVKGPIAARGFTLLEVLVALIVLALGLLGLAGLQVLSLKFNTQSYERTQATLQIDSIIDRMRANSAGATAGFYNIALTGTPPAYSGSCPSNCSGGAADVAAYDLNQWLTTMTAPGMLSNAQASITFDGGVLHTVTVTWWENDLQITQSMTVQLFPG
jgi:type IV pilus assembly protein PilV